MKNQVLLRIRFPYEDNIPSIAERVKKFETFFYNVFNTLVRRPEKISMEIQVIAGGINFYVGTPKSLAPAIGSLVFGDFADAEIQEIPAYEKMELIPIDIAVGYEAELVGSDAFMLRTASKMNSDPLSPFFNFMAEISPNDALLYQVIVDPLDESFEQSESSGIYGFAEKEDVTNVKLKFKTCLR